MNKKERNLFLILFFFQIFGCFLTFKMISNQMEMLQINLKYLKNLISSYILINNDNTTEKKIDLNLKSNMFLNIHKNIVIKRIRQKVVFYKIQPVGYGNRIYSMLSAFLTAIISDSAFLIDWPFIDNYINCTLFNVFTKFNDKSFLDFNQKKSKICRIKTKSINTWSKNKQLGFLQGICVVLLTRFFCYNFFCYISVIIYMLCDK